VGADLWDIRREVYPVGHVLLTPTFMVSLHIVSQSEFARELRTVGHFDLGEQSRLYAVARQCAQAMGSATSGSNATTGGGRISIFGVGAIPWYVVRFLAGAARGKAEVAGSTSAVKDGLEDLLR
jgi:hypothetical protein